MDNILYGPKDSIVCFVHIRVGINLMAERDFEYVDLPAQEQHQGLPQPQVFNINLTAQLVFVHILHQIQLCTVSIMLVSLLFEINLAISTCANNLPWINTLTNNWPANMALLYLVHIKKYCATWGHDYRNAKYIQVLSNIS